MQRIMTSTIGSLTETTIDGPRTQRWSLECGECTELNAHRIARLGLEEAVAPYRRVRLAPVGSFFLATTSSVSDLLISASIERFSDTKKLSALFSGR